jgi:hypothetical protein
MEHLSKHIAEAVSKGRNAGNRYSWSKELPETLDCEKIIDFLERNGFDRTSYGRVTDLFWYATMRHRDAFGTDRRYQWIIICRDGDDSVFCIIPDKAYRRYIVSSEEPLNPEPCKITSIIEYRDYRELVEEMSKHYG